VPAKVTIRNSAKPGYAVYKLAKGKIRQKGGVVFDVLMSANGQVFVPKKNHPSQKGKLALIFQHN